MVEFRIWKGRPGEQAKLQPWASEEQTLDTSEICLKWSHDKRAKRSGNQEGWLRVSIHLPQDQEESIPMSRRSGKNAIRPVMMNKEYLVKFKHKN